MKENAVRIAVKGKSIVMANALSLTPTTITAVPITHVQHTHHAVKDRSVNLGNVSVPIQAIKSAISQKHNPFVPIQTRIICTADVDRIREMAALASTVMTCPEFQKVLVKAEPVKSPATKPIKTATMISQTVARLT